MSERVLSPINKSLTGELYVPGDKSISHRAIIFGSLANGETTVTHFLDGEDCMRTIDAFRLMGVEIEKNDNTVKIVGKGISGLSEPLEPINLGNSGTTARLLLGVLAGLPFHFTLFGDSSLTKRPMDRVAIPLRVMGATIDGRENGKFLPLSVRGGELTSITFETPVKSAQVKSGVLLAGLLANGVTSVSEKTTTRDHTENMLQAFGGNVSREAGTIRIEGKQRLSGTTIQVPGDISSAAFFMVAAAIVPRSNVTIKDVGLNPTRTGIIDVMKQMGVSIEVTVERTVGGEPIGSIFIEHSPINGTVIGGDIIPRIIDEIPIIALLATQANGKTIIRDAEELKYKETDRIASVVTTLQALGATIEATEDGMIIEGNGTILGGFADSHGDHRIGMMIAIASLIAKDTVTLKNEESIAISYPNFFVDLEKLISKSS
ncbi:3-phosphoshikimate 1-carboxyvinyltransferase [Aquibacillus salsiterrae]|uniref:3-phosphoshikimate 1-carboxyvinyltransferase n=1 Tax=Aquibacillus salsiterrae TaxID=2950439 RepID=A0A9X3WBT6_9BACI|nr:3-phosphoshikimate 1-carboxyvinyltransferase [Aquibacillus salsiterrae]MDC3415371.1 3-phosphoshikimate 1-carboxyvinyltransferase [Aquibacillus salsiterrae]